MRKICSQSLCVELEKPGRCDGILVTKDERETAEKSVGLWGDFPGSGLTRASQAGLRRKKESAERRDSIEPVCGILGRERVSAQEDAGNAVAESAGAK